MIKTKQEKQEFVKTFEKEIQEKRNFILADYQGLKVSELEDLRKKLQILNAKLFVIRNRLVAKVFKNIEINGFDEYLKGPTAIVLEKDDLVKTIKQLFIFSKSNNKLKLKAGWYENKLLTSSEISRIAQLPPKEHLLAAVAGGILAPLIKLMNVLRTPLRNLVVVLKQIKKAG
ncbi:MAG: 50S ribosomal protein L10 [Elusimicrobiota bacterium]